MIFLWIHILVPKDETKPSYYGIYFNKNGSPDKLNILDTVKNPQDYYLPYLESNLKNAQAVKQNDVISQEYFYNSTILNIGDTDITSQNKWNNHYLYLENCYFIAANNVEEGKLDMSKNNIALIKGNLTGKEYKLTLSKDKGGKLIFYQYDKESETLKTISSYTLTNTKIDYNLKDTYYKTAFMSVPKDADLVFRTGINICDTRGNIIFADNEVFHDESFTEKYNFSDVSTSLKTRVIQDFKGLSNRQRVMRDAKVPNSYMSNGAETYKNRNAVYDALGTLPKNDAEKEYIRYVRAMYIMYSQNSYIDSVLSQYLYNAASFKDIDYAAREVLYNSNTNYGIIVNSNNIKW